MNKVAGFRFKRLGLGVYLDITASHDAALAPATGDERGM
jgi:hypothetical protein